MEELINDVNQEVITVKIAKEYKPDEVVIFDKKEIRETEYVDLVSWDYKVIKEDGKEERWILGRCCRAVADDYLSKRKDIKSFSGACFVDIYINQICSTKEYIKFKKDKPKDKYTYVSYIIDAEKGLILFKLHYANNQKEALPEAQKLAVLLGYKKPPLKEIRCGYMYRTKETNKLTKFYTPYEVKIGCERI